MTERGLRWLALSLALALAAGVVSLADVLGVMTSSMPDRGVELTAIGTWEFLLFASVLPGFAGFWRVRQGQQEYGPGHASDVKRGTYAFAVGAAGAAALFVTGLVLGAVYIPNSTAFGLALRTVHHIAPAFFVPFLGLFLLFTLWRLSARTVRWLGLGALALSLFVTGLGVVLLYAGLSLYPDLPLWAWLGLQAVPSLLSTGLWFTACLLAGTRLHGAAPTPVSGAWVG